MAALQPAAAPDAWSVFMCISGSGKQKKKKKNTVRPEFGGASVRTFR